VPARGRTILGTPRAPLPAGAARGAVSVRAAPPAVAPGARFTVELAVESRSAADFPGLAPRDDPGTDLVEVKPSWHPVDGGPPLSTEALRLPDVAAGGDLVFRHPQRSHRPGAISTSRYSRPLLYASRRSILAADRCRPAPSR
jgi:hypothetical protein